MFFLQYVAKHYKGEIQEKALGYAEKVANKNIRKIALAKAIRDNNIEKSVPYTKNLANDLYTNDPRLVKELSNKTDWTTDKSTTSILKNNPATYYSKKGTRVKLLGLVGQIGDFLSVFDLLSFAMQDELDFNSPIPLDFGPLSAAAGIAGAFAQELKAEQDELLDEIVLKELEVAKREGRDAVEEFIMDYGHNERYDYRMLSVSKNTADKLSLIHI